MALSNISSEHINTLMLELNLPALQNTQIRQSIQRNSNNYGKLKTLCRQLAFIKQEIEEIVKDSLVSVELDRVSCKFKKIPGNHYYLYQNKEKEELFFSMLEPEIWNYQKNNIFIGKYLYDYDYSLQRIDS